jgi:hypothetical protein
MTIVPYEVLSPGGRLCRDWISIPFLFFLAMASAVAEINNWTKPTSGFWEEQAFWSLGVLPEATQEVVFNNAGWKALAVGANTAQKFAQSMRVKTLRLGAPVDSYNTLLLTYAGYEQPLRTESLIVESNSAIAMHASLLEVTNTSTDGSTGNLYVGGTIHHGDFSGVKVHGGLSVGRFGQGAYFLTNGTLAAASVGIGGFEPGRFVQYGGFNNVGSIQVNLEGEFEIYGGELTASNGITVGIGDYANFASFRQDGGTVEADTTINGRYVLNGGSITGKMSVPGNSFQRVNGSVSQSGGTNFASSMDLGFPNRFGGGAIYVLSNGVVRVDSSTTFRGGWFTQYNGLHTIASYLVMRGTYVGPGYAYAEYFLGGGTLSVGELAAQAAIFRQEGGSNLVAGELILNAASPDPFAPPPPAGRYTLTGGFLSARNVIVNPTYGGGFLQTGGSDQIAERLTLEGGVDGSLGYALEGGTLAVKEIYVGSRTLFRHTSGTINHSGVLFLNHGNWQAATGDCTLGPLRLTVGLSTNSTIIFPNGSSILRLANSSEQPWDPRAILYLTNWHGSVSGGGATQLYFGSTADGLTAQQLAQVRFSLSGGLYPARLLVTGEVVPQAADAEINSWTNAASGNWHDLYWSLGVLPNSSQSEVRIVNSGSKAVAIQPSTPIDFPSSMTVRNLRVDSVAPDVNLLLLNFFGTAVPLRVINDFTIHRNSRVLMLYSGLEVNNHLNVAGTLDQEGGLALFTNGTMQVDGQVNLTNASLQGLDMHIGGTANGRVNHASAVVVLRDLIIAYNANSTAESNGFYSLRDGWLVVDRYLGVGGFGQGTLQQSNGTNIAGRVAISLGNYVKTGGALFAGDMRIFGGVASWGAAFSGNMSQSGGETMVTNILEMFGYADDIYRQHGTFNLSGGTLSASTIWLSGISVFTQSNGTVRANLLHLFDTFSPAGCRYNMFGGNLYTSNTVVSIDPSVGGFYQNGGMHVVSNTLSVGGHASYQLVRGTLSAPNIYLSGSPDTNAQLTVGEAVAPFAITNSDTITLSHGTLVVPVTQNFGSLFLYSGGGEIDFGHGTATLRFRDSHTNNWYPDWAFPHRLRILNWSGSTNGSGADRLIFGSNSSALTASQLAQIHFVDTAGKESRARILSTGEVVPSPPPNISSELVGTNVVLTWPDFSILQFATNVAGPYNDLLNAISPYTNNLNAHPLRFFRLRD